MNIDSNWKKLSVYYFSRVYYLPFVLFYIVFMYSLGPRFLASHFENINTYINIITIGGIILVIMIRQTRKKKDQEFINWLKIKLEEEKLRKFSFSKGEFSLTFMIFILQVAQLIVLSLVIFAAFEIIKYF